MYLGWRSTMTALTSAYFDQIAEGHVPDKNSPERISYEAEMTEEYDYTWAIQKFQGILAFLRSIPFTEAEIEIHEEVNGEMYR